MLYTAAPQVLRFAMKSLSRLVNKKPRANNVIDRVCVCVRLKFSPRVEQPLQHRGKVVGVSGQLAHIHI